MNLPHRIRRLVGGTVLGLRLLTTIVPVAAAESTIHQRSSPTINGETIVQENTSDGNESNQSNCVVVINGEVVADDCEEAEEYDFDFSSIFDHYFAR